MAAHVLMFTILRSLHADIPNEVLASDAMVALLGSDETSTRLVVLGLTLMTRATFPFSRYVGTTVTWLSDPPVGVAKTTDPMHPTAIRAIAKIIRFILTSFYKITLRIYPFISPNMPK